MIPLLQRVQQLAERRLPSLTRFRRAEKLPVQLHRKRIYIVPTGFGLVFSILLMVMLVGALNYANNAALLLTCLLGAASAASMLMAFRCLDGLRLGHIRAGHAIAGEPVELTLAFDSARTRQAVRVQLGANTSAFASEAGAVTHLKLMMPTSRRGWHPLSRLRIWSTWPLGLFRAWSWVYPDQQILVWPRPELAGPSPTAPDEDARHLRLRQGDELAALREYRAGDPQRHIAWKASARHDNLLVKDFERAQNRPQWQLDWRELAGLDDETRIARLARWVNEAQADQRHFSLWLPGEVIANGNGPVHYAHCMSALAQLP